MHFNWWRQQVYHLKLAVISEAMNSRFKTEADKSRLSFSYVDMPGMAQGHVFKVIYRLNLQKLSFPCVLWQFLCPPCVFLSNVVVMAKWWVPSIVVFWRRSCCWAVSSLSYVVSWSTVSPLLFCEFCVSSPTLVYDFKAAFPWYGLYISVFLALLNVTGWWGLR